MREIILACLFSFTPLSMGFAKELPRGVIVAQSSKTQESDTASVVIKAPLEVQVGDLIRIDVSDSNCVSYSWTVIPEIEISVFDGGKVVVAGTGKNSAKYLFIVAGAKGDTVDVQTHIVTVIGPDPMPGPGPVDVSLQMKVKQWCGLVKSENKKTEALRVAEVFDGIATLIDSNSLSTPEEVVEATAKGNAKVLGDARDAWKPFFEAVAFELKTLEGAGQLLDAKSHSEVWTQIAIGLKDYAG